MPHDRTLGFSAIVLGGLILFVFCMLTWPHSNPQASRSPVWRRMGDRRLTFGNSHFVRIDGAACPPYLLLFGSHTVLAFESRDQSLLDIVRFLREGRCGIVYHVVRQTCITSGIPAAMIVAVSLRSLPISDGIAVDFCFCCVAVFAACKLASSP